MLKYCFNPSQIWTFYISIESEEIKIKLYECSLKDILKAFPHFALIINLINKIV